MAPEERAKIKKEIEFIKWKKNAPVIQPIAISDASDNSEADEPVDHITKNKINPKTGERIYIEKRKTAKKGLYNKRNLYNESSDEDALDFLQKESDWKEKRDEFRNEKRAK